MDVNFASTPVHFTNQVVYVYHNPNSQQPRGYTAKNISVVKWLSITQLVLGFACFISQIIATALFEIVETERNVLIVHSDIDFYRFNDVDHGGTGIWVGLFIIIAASIGMAGWKQNRAVLIVTHLVFNMLVLLAAVSLIGTSASSVSNLKSCMAYGESYYYYRDRRTVDREFFGEKLILSGSFYCRHSLFKAWLAFSIIMVIASSVTFVFSLTLLVYNSLAVCSRCCSCCYGYYNGAVTAYPIHQMVYPAPVAYNTNGAQMPVADPHYQINPLMSQTATSQAPIPQVNMPQVTMPPSYEAQAAGFNPPPKYERMDN